MSQNSSSKNPSIKSISDYIDGIETLYLQGLPRGSSTGWSTLDVLYHVHRGQLAIVTGIPSSGKSELIDALAINLIQAEKWNVAFFSPENKPGELHCVKHIEKIIGRQFQNSALSGEAFKTHKNHIRFIANCTSPTIDNILEDARNLALGMDDFQELHMLVIDPYNEIEHKRPVSMSETEYISLVLTQLKHFAHTYNVAVFLVAHPAKMMKDKISGEYACPTPYDISGSAHFRNKADVCLAVHRQDLTSNSVQVHVQKIRFKHVGRPGMVMLSWDRASGRFYDALSE